MNRPIIAFTKIRIPSTLAASRTTPTPDPCERLPIAAPPAGPPRGRGERRGQSAGEVRESSGEAVPPEDLLTTAAEVAIAIAGFSGVLAALAPRSRGEWPAGSRILLGVLLLSTGAVVAFSFLPLLLLSGWKSPSVWPLASGVHALYLLAVAIYRFDQVRAEGFPDALRTPLVATGPSIFTACLVLQVANTAFVRAPWPYLTAIVLSILATFMVFAALLRLLWSDVPDA